MQPMSLCSTQSGCTLCPSPSTYKPLPSVVKPASRPPSGCTLLADARTRRTGAKPCAESEEGAAPTLAAAPPHRHGPSAGKSTEASGAKDGDPPAWG